MPPVWRWILAIGSSAFVLVAGIVVIFVGGEDYSTFGWVILAVGAISVAINMVMRRQFF
jgi:hypothetical protein